MIIRTMRSYTDRLKAQVLKELEEGTLPSYEAAKRKYGIQGNVTIAKWIKKANKNHLLHKREVIDLK